MAKKSDKNENSNQEKKPIDLITVDESVLKEKAQEQEQTASKGARDTSVIHAFGDDTGRDNPKEPEKDVHLNMTFEDVTNRDNVVEVKGRDMTAVHAFGEGAGLNDNKFEAPKFLPTPLSWKEKIVNSVAKVLGVKPSLERFGERFSLVEDQNSSEEVSGQAYVDMKADLEKLRKTAPKATRFVESHARQGRLLAASKGHLGAIADLGEKDLADNARVSSILGLLITKDHTQVGAKRQKTAIQSFEKHMRVSSKKTFMANADLYIETMVDVMKNARDVESRSLAFNACDSFRKDGALNDDQTLQFMKGLKPLLRIGGNNLDMRAADLIVETLSKEDLINQSEYMIDIASKIEKDITKENVLLRLAKYEAFTPVALQKNIAKAKTEKGGLLARTFSNGLTSTKVFFKDNKELTEKNKLTIGEIYQQAIPQILKDNKVFRDELNVASKDIEKHFAQTKQDVFETSKETQKVAAGIQFTQKNNLN